jgi:hypothetical protein
MKGNLRDSKNQDRLTAQARRGEQKNKLANKMSGQHSPQIKPLMMSGEANSGGTNPQAIQQLMSQPLK